MVPGTNMAGPQEEDEIRGEGGGATHPQHLRSLVIGAGCGGIPPEEADEREEPRSSFP